MSLKAGFAEADVTPPEGVHKAGWGRKIVGNKILDPLFVRAAVFESNGVRLGFVQSDTISPHFVGEIRERICAETGFDGANVMVAATHNHAGPAFEDWTDTKADPRYVGGFKDKVVAVFVEAMGAMTEAQAGFDWTFEWRVSYNRRVVLRDGTARTQYHFTQDKNCLCIEGPIDPEVAVLALRGPGGEPMGLIVNFTMHPTQHGGTDEISAGYPGLLARRMKERGWPVTLFLNGAAGNIHAGDVRGLRPEMGIDEIGTTLADRVSETLEGMAFDDDVRLHTASTTVEIPYRRPTAEELEGKFVGGQCFWDPKNFAEHMETMKKRIAEKPSETAEVQVHRFNDTAFAAVPCELFVQWGLQIKEKSWPAHGLVVSYANGRMGYIPTAEAFRRGGYEPTGNLRDPGSGGVLVEAAVDLIRRGD